jgi:uncharacterized membrane protein
MSQTVIEFLQGYGLSPELTVFIISLLPILELRGGLIAAKFLGLPLLNAFIICYLGNILPIPFILLFIQKIFALMKKHNILTGFINWIEEKAVKKSDSIRNKQLLGLFFFVAVPLPGTGGWTGALIASILEIPIKKSFPAIALGVLGAGVIMITLTYFIPGFFGF